VQHAARERGESKYSYYKLARLNFDLITGFTLVPLQMFTLFAMACAAGSLLLVLILAFMRIFMHDDTNGVFTLFGILFFLVSVCMVGIGLIGEYVGRTYQCVQQRPRFVVREVLEKLD
jgi:undecaprenyl-phosphate 4-deoxy-4-formamido-L-arabinose transferase